MNSPKYLIVRVYGPGDEEILWSTDDRLEAEDRTNLAIAADAGSERIADLYIRDRDLRRQFSPAEMEAVIERVLKESDWPVAAKDVNIIVEEFRKLVLQP